VAGLLERERLPASRMASKFGIKSEGETGKISTYRDYPCGSVSVFDVPLQMVQLFAENDIPQKLVFTFANLGGTCPSLNSTPSSVEHQSRTILGKLKMLYGAPQWVTAPERIGLNDILRSWDTSWGKVTLHHVKDNVVSVEMQFRGRNPTSAGVPVAKSRLSPPTRLPNGDIVLESIPMVDQGKRGYCSPATLERVLRYFNINDISMDTLAVETETSRAAEGTAREKFTAALKKVGRSYQMELEVLGRKESLKKIRRSIDAGVPVIWHMLTSYEVENFINSYTAERVAATNSPEKTVNKGAGLRLSSMASQGHTRLIVGYNVENGELAVSDSWGRGAECRWIPEECIASLTMDGESLIVLRPR
jgi:hypothetical protein